MPKRTKPKSKPKRSVTKKPSKKGMGKSGRCWAGYKPTPGKKPYSKGSCQKAN